MENGNAPVTRADLAELRGEVHGDLILLQEKLTETIQDSETRVLNAFYKYAEATQKRLALLEGTDANILSRLATMESRILELEKRANIPPGETA